MGHKISYQMIIFEATPWFFFIFSGAAIEDGSLKPGDRLLEVNDVCVDGMLQSDVVTLLRNVPLESTVNLMVSRHAVVAIANTEATTAADALDSASATKTTKDTNTKKLQFQLGNNMADAKPSFTTDEEVIMCERKMMFFFLLLRWHSTHKSSEKSRQRNYFCVWKNL